MENFRTAAWTGGPIVGTGDRTGGPKISGTARLDRRSKRQAGTRPDRRFKNFGTADTLQEKTFHFSKKIGFQRQKMEFPTEPIFCPNWTYEVKIFQFSFFGPEIKILCTKMGTRKFLGAVKKSHLLPRNGQFGHRSCRKNQV